MMTLDYFRDSLPDTAKDVRLNLGTVLTVDGAPGLTESQINGVALASAYAANCSPLVDVLLPQVDGATAQAAQAAATIMAMNNVYYRFVHLVGGAYKTMPAKLRMNVIAQPGIAKADFELMSMAVSAINGCGMCMEAHAHELTQAGLTEQAVQSAVRIAAVVNAAAQAVRLQSLGHPVAVAA